MNSGIRKTRTDFRDYDFFKSHKHLFGSLTQFPTEFNVDVGLWMPSQELPQAITGLPDIPALPYGCTDYAGADACNDEDGQLHNPMDLENITHANAEGGTDIRTMLKAAMQVFGRTAYFNVKPNSLVDAFDCARLAMYSTQPEKRVVIVGSIWYPTWQYIKADGIIPMPMSFNVDGPWHCSVVCGWKNINGIPYLVGKSWQGPTYGDRGFHYFSREVFNSIMAQSGTAMFTLSKTAPKEVYTIDLSWAQNIASYIRMLITKNLYI